MRKIIAIQLISYFNSKLNCVNGSGVPQGKAFVFTIFPLSPYQLVNINDDYFSFKPNIEN